MSPVSASSGGGGEEDGGSGAEGSGLDSRSLTASLPGETHTLGNAVRALLIRNPDVEFAGYSVPHPTQIEMNLRIQTAGEPPTLGARYAMASTPHDPTRSHMIPYGPRRSRTIPGASGIWQGPALNALEQALEELTAICDAMEVKYDEAMETFNAKRQSKERGEQDASSRG
ncbi:hypothetical protein ACSSS7_006733 [Eimeria intestinalis]